MNWFAQSERPLPWKGIKNPYLIWLSEVILQQTRTAQGLPYYEKFKNRFPTIDLMANAHEDEIMKLWEGLGYYSRARNMHFTAKYITEELGGEFPDTLEGLKKLKGVGPYTAAAIASFAYDLPHAVLDGNVYRVLSRFFGIKAAIDISKNKKIFEVLAQEVLDASQAGKYNQAIMDFGATMCKPKSPDCPLCPLSKKCIALKEELVTTLPIKSKKIRKKKRYFHYFISHFEGKILLRKRIQKDIWQNLYEFPMLETKDEELKISRVQKTQLWQQLFHGNEKVKVLQTKKYQQELTHQKISAYFWEINLNVAPVNIYDFILIDSKNLAKFAFPKIIALYLENNSLNL